MWGILLANDLFPFPLVLPSFLCLRLRQEMHLFTHSLSLSLFFSRAFVVALCFALAVHSVSVPSCTESRVSVPISHSVPRTTRGKKHRLRSRKEVRGGFVTQLAMERSD